MNINIVKEIDEILKGSRVFTMTELYNELGRKWSKNTIKRTLDQMQSHYDIDIFNDVDKHQGKASLIQYPVGFSVNQAQLSAEDARQMEQLLGNFKKLNLPWVEEFETKFKDLRKTYDNKRPIIYYDTNDYYDAIDMFAEMYDHVSNKEVIEFVYKDFDVEPRKVVLHPYFMKEYIGRWYVFGLDNEIGVIKRFALDRIDLEDNEIVMNKNMQYCELDPGFDVDKYFKNIVGVSQIYKEAEEVTQRMTKYQYNYTYSKPIHRSQHPTIDDHPLADDNHVVFTLKVVPNYEFRQLLRSFGKEVEVLGPQHLRDMMAADVKELAEIYGVI